MPGPILCALPFQGRDPLSRSYRVSLPSSLTVIHPSASVYSTRLRVSVCGTGTQRVKFSGFSRQSDYLRCWIVPKDAPYFQVRLSPWICLWESTPTPLNGLFRQPAAVPLLRLHVTSEGSNGMLTVFCFSIRSRMAHATPSTLNGMLPYRYRCIPRLRYAAYTRLLSTPGSSTSELLRTL